jgi:hypothetical protein
MKNAVLFIAVILSFILLTGCDSYRVVQIEVYNPGIITFPPGVKDILILNNSAQQPDNIGHRVSLLGMKDTVISASADSTAYHFCMSLGNEIADSPLFGDVRVSEDTLRYDSVFYERKYFDKYDISKLLSLYNVDAVISLDRLMFNSIVGNTSYYDGYYLYNIELFVGVAGEVSAYIPNESYSLPFKDSAAWVLEDFKTVDLEHGMKYISADVGKKMAKNFVPYWTQDNRWYYVDFSSSWRRAAAYAYNSKWTEAYYEWNRILENTDKGKSKARLYANMALGKEMEGDFESAYSFAEKSYELFLSIAGEDDSFTKLQKVYIDVLKKRIESDKILTRQLDEKQE